MLRNRTAWILFGVLMALLGALFFGARQTFWGLASLFVSYSGIVFIFGAGATADNTVVVRTDGSHRAGLRFEDECARHKVLDLIGDLALAGFGICARVVGVRSGHALNRELAQKIRQAKEGR